jgi:hypothetical protein
MTTSNPAMANNWDQFVGRVNAGLYADLVVVDNFHEDPYRNLIEAVDADIRLTLVNGQPVWGDIDIMTELKGNDWETVTGPGFDKAVDVTDRFIAEGTQSWSTILSNMEMAMALNQADIDSTWSANTDSYSSMQGNVLNDIFTTGDTRHFGIIEGSNHANMHVDLIVL